MKEENIKFYKKYILIDSIMIAMVVMFEIILFFRDDVMGLFIVNITGIFPVMLVMFVRFLIAGIKALKEEESK